MRRLPVVALLAAMVVGCAGHPPVDRAYGATIVRGRFVEPRAYAAFLRGAIAEAAGGAGEALAAYSEAKKLDPDSPEIDTRIGDVRCGANPNDNAAQSSFDHAIDLEPRYAPAWAASAKCAQARGDAVTSRTAAERAAAIDPSAGAANVLLARGQGAARDVSVREQLVALTITASDPLVAWDALASWSEAHADVALWSRAVREAVRIAPARRDAAARVSEELAGLGDVADARAVAAAAVEAGARPFASMRYPLAARLALDEALARHDADAVRRRASRARLGLDEAAGRALLAGDASLSQVLASVVARGDPTARGARLVVAAAGGGVLEEVANVRPDDAPSSAAAFVAFAASLVHATSAQLARPSLAAIHHDALVPSDDRVVRAAVELVSRDAIGIEVLPPDGAVELCAIRGESPREPLPSLDIRHEYLAVALLHPESKRARDLGERLALSRASDPVVAAADSLVRLAVQTPPIDAQAASDLLARNPADPLLAAIALRLALKVGDADVVRRARASLAAIRVMSPRGVE